MDMGFSFRKRRRLAEPVLSVLLADAAAAQATSPTARAQAQVATPVPPRSAADRCIDLFAGHDPDGPPRRFAALAPRQPT